MVLKIYSPPSMAAAIKATAAIAEVQLEFPQYLHFQDNKTAEFLAKFPHGKIPALEDSETGFKLFEGSVITRYIAALSPNSGLLGHSLEETALVDQFVHFADSEILKFTIDIYQMIGNILPYHKPLHTACVERQLRSLQTLEKILLTRTYLVGERLTLADIAVATIVYFSATVNVDAPLRAKLPNTMRHLDLVINQPKLKEIYDKSRLVETALQYTPPPKEKKEPAQKKEKPKAIPKVTDEADDDMEEGLVPEEPKPKNPLDLLPKSSFNLEDWKRAYSNKDTRGAGGSLEWFYQNFDKEGFSVWRVDFKYNEELTIVFMSSNQIGGFFNRLEASRKYLFGSVGVLGENNNSIITGAFILRGPEVKPVVECAPDYESYDYKRLDLENPEDKAFFEAALAWDLEIDGKKWADGKNFK